MRYFFIRVSINVRVTTATNQTKELYPLSFETIERKRWKSIPIAF